MFRPSQRVVRTAAAIAVVGLLSFLLARFEVFSTIGVLQRPAPREIPVAVTGPDPQASITRDALNTLPGSPIAAREASSVADARRLLRSRDISGAVAVEGGAHMRLLLASAGGLVETDELKAQVPAELESAGFTVTITDVIAAPADDPRTVSAGRLASGWVLFAVAAAIIIGRIWEHRPRRLNRALLRITTMASLAVTAGWVGTATVALTGPASFEPHWSTLPWFGAVLVLGVGLAAMAVITWFGRLGAWASALTFVVLGIPGAVGAYPLTPLPTVIPTTIAWLPPGAGSWAVHGIVYFEAVGVSRVVWVYLVWAVLGALFIIMGTTDEQSTPVRRRPSHYFHPALRRRPLASILIGTIALGLLFVGPAAPAFRHADTTPALSLPCQPFTKPKTVDGLNRVVQGYRDQSSFTGGDVGASALMSDGRGLFVFGDTLRGKGYGSARIVRNSMLVFGTTCAGVVQRAGRGAVIPDRDDGVGYWPMSITRIGRQGSADIVLVTAQRVRSTGGGQGDGDLFGFTNLGPAIAQFRVSDGGVPVLQRVEDIGPDSPDAGRPAWGAATARVGDHLYLYGTSSAGPGTIGWQLSVARAPVSNPWDVSSWRYWNGRAWARSSSAAVTLIGTDGGGVSQTLSVFKQAGTWYALSKRGDFIGSDLVAWTATSPTGPFTAHPALAKIPSTAQLRYMPLAHPEILPEPGTMVVSISRNTSDTSAIEQDPTLYRPEFIRVDLPR